MKVEVNDQDHILEATAEVRDLSRDLAAIAEVHKVQVGDEKMIKEKRDKIKVAIRIYMLEDLILELLLNRS